MNLNDNAHLTRQLDLIPMECLDMPINIVGVGAIGSFTALALVKMGMTNIRVWDHDTVSVENLSNQFYRHTDIGSNKAEALRDLIYQFTGVYIEAFPCKYNVEDPPETSGIFISAVDSMETRNLIRETLILTRGASLIIDPRMGAESYLQYAVHPKTDWYKNTMYTDERAVQEPCTAKSTVYTATLAAGLIVKTIKNYIMGQPYPKSISWDIKSSKSTLKMYPNKEINETP